MVVIWQKWPSNMYFIFKFFIYVFTAILLSYYYFIFQRVYYTFLQKREIISYLRSYRISNLPTHTKLQVNNIR